ncbi:MAG: hypothetical protein GDA48_25515 [Hormoscilla sp. GM102CHS1]|nr:hypothetical protein [Hormoscilla sp. GM102CHS1]
MGTVKDDLVSYLLIIPCGDRLSSLKFAPDRTQPDNTKCQKGCYTVGAKVLSRKHFTRRGF